jgi:hypothetical protein
MGTHGLAEVVRARHDGIAGELDIDKATARGLVVTSDASILGRTGTKPKSAP